jgi:hypothetical protein
MNVVDSSGCLEYFANGHNADFFAPAIEYASELIVPTLSLVEVFKRVLQPRGEGDALQAVAVMIQGRVTDLHRSGAECGEIVRQVRTAHGRQCDAFRSADAWGDSVDAG